jgi:BirA family transcriptional regulator, biotin operon repressor / biotin---[acetyl-CoA-carboxylase] ligase
MSRGETLEQTSSPQTSRWPWTWVIREEVRSTSDTARQLIERGLERLPLVVWARKQTCGRGRGAHSWWSDAGSLTLTIALEPHLHGLRPEHTARVALASAVALVDVLEPLLPRRAALGIRWPNDLEADGRKLGGILPELVETPHGQRLLVGIGLNVQTQLDQAPLAVRQMATSLAALCAPGAEPITPASLLPRVLDRLAVSLEALSADDPALAERWRQLDTLRGRPVRIDLGGKIVAGTALGLDDRGGLRLAAKTEQEPVTLYGGQVLRDA